MEDLDFSVLKTNEQFYRNYTLHDKACVIGDNFLIAHGYQIKDFGEDRRKQPVWEKGEDRPDRIVLKDGKEIALIDWKGHNREDWMINVRAYKSYLNWSKNLCIPVYVCFVVVPRKIAKFVKLPPMYKYTTRMMPHDKNLVIIFDPKDVHPFSELLYEFEQLTKRKTMKSWLLQKLKRILSLSFL